MALRFSNKGRGYARVLVLGAALHVVGLPAAGQQIGPDSLTLALRAAVAEYDSDNPVLAEPLLRDVLRASPGAFDPATGSAAYWLGVLLWEQERRSEAVGVWHRGWIALRHEGLVDLPLGDRLLWGVFSTTDERRYEMASGIYNDVLQNLEWADSTRTRDIAARILVPLRLILPDALRHATGLTDEPSAEEGRLRQGAGGKLVEWWRGMDGLPGTERNERLIEHLRRVSTAREQYPSLHPGGFDDRGSVYVRFGPPWRTSTTRLNPFDLGQSFTNTTRGIRTELSTTVPFRRNEFWVYPAVDRKAQFLFIQGARGEYRLGTVNDLVPRYLRTPRYARLRLKILEAILRDLALYHPWTYSSWYEEVAGYITDIELDELSTQASRMSGQPGLRIPARFVPRSLSPYYMGHHVMEERRVVRERDTEIPASFFDDRGVLSDVRVALRTARFLNEDGTTRVELYWTALTDEFARAHRRLNGGSREIPYDFVVDLSLTEYDPAEVRVGSRRLRSRVTGVREGDNGIVFPQELVHPRLESGHRLALQWDIQVLPREDEDIRHSMVGIAVARLDSLERLGQNRRFLEMSDLKPILVDRSTGVDGPAFPGGVLTPDALLGLQFEIYHLTFGADDQTSYTIAYEIEREEDVAFRTRQRQDPASQTIKASSRYAGTTTRERQTIVLDFSDWDSPGRLRILVRVTDDNTGQQAVRMLDFDLALED